MSDTICLATRSGLAICQRDHDGWRVIHRVLNAYHVTSIIARGKVISKSHTIE